MNLVDDIYLIFCGNRRIGDFLTQLTNVVNAVVGSGVNLDDIEHRAVVDSPAHLTFTAWVAVLRIKAIYRF